MIRLCEISYEMEFSDPETGKVLHIIPIKKLGIIDDEKELPQGVRLLPEECKS